MARSHDRDQPQRPTDPFGKTPRHDLETEADLISNAISQDGAFDLLAVKLKPEMFYSEGHQLVWAAALQLIEDGVDLSYVTIRNYLHDQGQLARVQHAAGLERLLSDRAFVHLSQLEEFATRVRNDWRIRELSGKCWALAAGCYGEIADVQQYIEKAEEEVSKLASADSSTTMVPIGESIREVFTAFHEAGGQGHGIRSGLQAFDAMTNGMEFGDLVIVAARPGMGKSALAMQLATFTGAATHADGRPLGAAVFSLEMKHKQLSLRSVCSMARVDANTIKANQCSPADWHRLTDAASWLSKVAVKFDDAAGQTPLAIRSKARQYAAELAKQGKKLALVVIDYLQLIDGQQLLRRSDNREQEVAKISKFLKQMAKELDVVVVALSQLSRECEKQKDKRPNLSHLRESGAVEQDADRIVFVYREEYYLKEKTPSDLRGVAELILAKQRGGRTGTALTRFVDRYTLFEDLDGQPQESGGGHEW